MPSKCKSRKMCWLILHCNSFPPPLCLSLSFSLPLSLPLFFSLPISLSPSPSFLSFSLRSPAYHHRTSSLSLTVWASLRYVLETPRSIWYTMSLTSLSDVLYRSDVIVCWVLSVRPSCRRTFIGHSRSRLPGPQSKRQRRPATYSWPRRSWGSMYTSRSTRTCV